MKKNTISLLLIAAFTLFSRQACAQQYLWDYITSGTTTQQYPVDVHYNSGYYYSLHANAGGNIGFVRYDATTNSITGSAQLSIAGLSLSPVAMVNDVTYSYILFNFVETISGIGVNRYGVSKVDPVAGTILWTNLLNYPTSSVTVNASDIAMDAGGNNLYISGSIQLASGGPLMVYAASMPAATGSLNWQYYYSIPTYSLASNNIFFYDNSNIY
ncbi:MAG: hypothetical protein ACHQRM_14355, partial [Bacteroidia bacterium]